MTVSSFGLNHIIMAFIGPQFLIPVFCVAGELKQGTDLLLHIFPLLVLHFWWHLRAGEAEILRQRLGDEPVGQTAAQADA